MNLRRLWWGGLLALATVKAEPPPLILISLDAFRHDYCALHPAETPTLRGLIALGVVAEGLIPVFPSNTFPNHYSIVTGLYPTNHGMVNNDFFDAETSSFFHSNISVFVKNPHWWGGEPIWVTAVRQGRKSAASFWAGSEAEISGVRPTYWRDYDYSVPFDSRLEQLVGWLKLPQDKRPAVITFYLEEANTAGHLYGPDSPELLAAIKLLDGRIGAIISRLKQETIEANIVIVSDHGMNSVSGKQVTLLEDYLDLDTVQVDFQGSVAGLRPIKGTVDSLMASLTTLPHATVYRVEDLPARLHVRPGARIPPVWVVPELGWSVVNKAGLEKTRQRSPDKSYLRGDHGYDPVNPTMHGIFIAYGPSFLSGKVIPEFENVHIYNLLCAATELKPAPNDGDDRLVKTVLR